VSGENNTVRSPVICDVNQLPLVW